MHARARDSDRRRAGGDAGFALPVVIFLILAGLAIGGAAVTAALGGQTGVSRDYDVKDALGVAEAGVERTLERYNLSTSLADPCGAGCTESLSNGTTYTSWAELTPHSCPSVPHNTVDIVSEGTADGQTRRIYTQAKSATSSCPFLEAGVIGLNSIHLDSNATVTADVATNGDVSMDANSNLDGCAQVGEGYAVTGAGVDGWDCSLGTLYGTTSLPPVNQGDVVTNNQNSTLLSHLSGKKADACFSGFRADGTADPAKCGQPGSRELVLTNNVSLTLGSGNYSLCRLRLISTSELKVAAGAIVRIYFDDPNECGYEEGDPGTSQLEIDSNAQVTVSGGDGHVAMLFVGSETIPTEIWLRSNTLLANDCSQDLVIYAPRTDVHLNSNSYYCGAIAGKTIEINSNSEVQLSNDASGFDVNAADDHYYVEEFKECTGAASAYASPFDNC
jgi:hypothetical protein